MVDIIRNPLGERLDFAFHPGADGCRNIVVIGHGVTGHKDRPTPVALADGLARAGIPSLRFSYSGNGGSEGRFADSNIPKEVGDLGAVIDALEAYNIAYVGHSMGAAVGVLRASVDTRIQLLVSLAGMVHVREFAERMFGNLTPGKDLMWDKPGCILSGSYMDEMRWLDSVVGCAKDITVPWLFVHGSEDDSVLLKDSEDAFAAANDPKKLVVIDGADHLFEPGFGDQMADLVAAWCTEEFAKLR